MNAHIGNGEDVYQTATYIVADTIGGQAIDNYLPQLQSSSADNSRPRFLQTLDELQKKYGIRINTMTPAIVDIVAAGLPLTIDHQKKVLEQKGYRTHTILTEGYAPEFVSGVPSIDNYGLLETTLDNKVRVLKEYFGANDVVIIAEVKEGNITKALSGYNSIEDLRNKAYKLFESGATIYCKSTAGSEQDSLERKVIDF